MDTLIVVEEAFGPVETQLDTYRWDGILLYKILSGM